MLEIGWWTFDAETQTLINRLSGQRIRFEGAEDGAKGLPRPPAQLRFSYEDAEVRYPVLVTARRETYGGPGFDHGDGKRTSLSWSIDHLASAAEWRRASNASAEVPPYGFWRRVDDALFNSLACWPSSEGAGPAPARVDAWGGWSNGVWSPRLRRVGAPQVATEIPLESGVRPFLEPLDSPPLSWRFADAERAAARAGLAGVRTLGNGWRFLPGDAALTGFETAMPHLRRSDGKAVMFPCKVRSSLDKDGYYNAKPQFFYADEDVFFLLDGGVSGPGRHTPGTWRFELDELMELGVRRNPGAAGPPPGLVCSRQVYDWRGPYLQPLPRLAQRLTAALIDGWLAWSGSRLRLLDDPGQLASLVAEQADVPGAPPPPPPLEQSGVGLDARSIVSVCHGYYGGRFAGRSMTGYLQQNGWTEAGYRLPPPASRRFGLAAASPGAPPLRFAWIAASKRHSPENGARNVRQSYARSWEDRGDLVIDKSRGSAR